MSTPPMSNSAMSKETREILCSTVGNWLVFHSKGRIVSQIRSKMISTILQLPVARLSLLPHVPAGHAALGTAFNIQILAEIELYMVRANLLY